jgi:serine/threonine protein kinase
MQGYSSPEDLLTDFRVRRSNALTKLFANPLEFARTLYIRKGLVIKTVSSLTFPIDEDLCFLAPPKGGEGGKVISCSTGRPWLQCRLLGVSGAVGIPSLLSLQEEGGEKKYILKEAPDANLFIRPTTKAPTPLSETPTCGFKEVERLNLLECDEFTNEALIGFALSHLLQVYQSKLELLKSKILTGDPRVMEPFWSRVMKISFGFYLSDVETPYSPVVEYYGGFVCANKSYLLMEYAELGSLELFIRGNINRNESHLLPSTVPSLIETIHYLQGHRLVPILAVRRRYVVSFFSQIICAIIALQGLGQFISGDLKLANVFVSSKPISVKFDGLKLKAPFTCKIADYGKSSLSIRANSGERFRFYNYNTASSITFSITTPPSFFRTPSGIPYYVIPRALMAPNITPLAYIRHAGYPFYKSIDLYTMVVSMMLNPAIYYPVMTNSSLRANLWDRLWFQDELDTITQKVHDMMLSGSPTSYGTVVPLLLDRKLKCNIIQEYFEGLKSLSG